MEGRAGQLLVIAEVEELSRGEVVIETAEPLIQSQIDHLRDMAGVKVQGQKGNILTLSVGKDVDVSAIVTFLAASGVRIEQVKKQEATLEEIYTTILREAEQK